MYFMGFAIFVVEALLSIWVFQVGLRHRYSWKLFPPQCPVTGGHIVSDKAKLNGFFQMLVCVVAESVLVLPRKRDRGADEAWRRVSCASILTLGIQRGEDANLWSVCEFCLHWCGRVDADSHSWGWLAAVEGWLVDYLQQRQGAVRTAMCSDSFAFVWGSFLPWRSWKSPKGETERRKSQPSAPGHQMLAV
jgi:hypothetical protein